LSLFITLKSLPPGTRIQRETAFNLRPCRSPSVRERQNEGEGRAAHDVPRFQERPYPAGGGPKGNRLVVGDQGGFESDYRLGIEGRTPVVVENNQSDTSGRCHPRLTRQPSAAGPRQPWAGCSTELVTEKLLQKEEGGPAS